MEVEGEAFKGSVSIMTENYVGLMCIRGMFPCLGGGS